MHFDFSALLVFLTFASGLIWLIDCLFFAKKRKALQESKEKKEELQLPLIVEYAKSFFPVFFIVLDRKSTV